MGRGVAAKAFRGSRNGSEMVGSGRGGYTDAMSATTPPDPSDPQLRPGDEVRPGTEGTGENLCPDCGGSGRTPDDTECQLCSGTGRVTQAVGGA